MTFQTLISVFVAAFAIAIILIFPITTTLEPNQGALKETTRPIAIWTIISLERENPGWDDPVNAGVWYRFLRTVVTVIGLVAGLLFAYRPNLAKTQRSRLGGYASMGFMLLGHGLVGVFTLIVSPFSSLVAGIAISLLLPAIFLLWPAVLLLEQYNNADRAA